MIKALLAVASTALFAATASATQTIAHRGVFHDVDDNWAYPENSVMSVIRAKNMGLAGVELDLRLSKDGVVLVTHDQIANRTTRNDGTSRGNYNPMDGLNGWRPKAIFVSRDSGDHWQHTLLKAYGRNGKLLDTPRGSDEIGTWHMQSLDSMFSLLRQYRSDTLNDPNFKIILDIQDADLFPKAAQVVRNHGLQNYVYLKFFVSRALYNDPRYHGSDTCYQYAKEHGLSGMNIIPQINDGELDINEDDDARIAAFQTSLNVGDYLRCWADAEARHSDAAHMPIVSASVPLDNDKATGAAAMAFTWAEETHRARMSIVPNPDVGRSGLGSCYTYTWQSTNVVPANFNYDARDAKQSFVNRMNPDYVIIDVMGNGHANTWKSDLTSFDQNLCR